MSPENKKDGILLINCPSIGGVLLKKVLLKNTQNSQENTCVRVSLQPQACNFIKKETLAQVFSCKFSKIYKNTFSYRTSLVSASGNHTVKSFPG